MKDLKQFISGLTFARGSNQPFFYQMPLFFYLPQGLIYSDFNFENTVEGIPLLILIYHMDNIPELILHLFLLWRGAYGYV